MVDNKEKKFDTYNLSVNKLACFKNNRLNAVFNDNTSIIIHGNLRMNHI